MDGQWSHAFMLTISNLVLGWIISLAPSNFARCCDCTFSLCLLDILDTGQSTQSKAQYARTQGISASALGAQHRQTMQCLLSASCPPTVFTKMYRSATPSTGRCHHCAALAAPHLTSQPDALASTARLSLTMADTVVASPRQAVSKSPISKV